MIDEHLCSFCSKNNGQKLIDDIYCCLDVWCREQADDYLDNI